MKNTLEKLVSDEIEYFEKIKVNIKNGQQPLTVNMENITNDVLSALPPKDTVVIYIIKANSDLELDYVNANDNREKLINGEEKFAVSKISEKSNWTKENKCIYVGQSKDIKKRLKEHLFINKAKNTYSLRLPKIFESGSVSIEIYEFILDYNDEENNKKHSRDIQIFEDLLWQYYKPLFGRCGAK